MKNPEQLREATDIVLHELTADDSLRYRILRQAAEGKGKETRRGFHPLPVFCTAVAALLIAVLVLNSLKPVNQGDPGQMNNIAAGADETVRPVDRQNTSPVSVLLYDVKPEDVTSIEISGIGRTDNPQQCAELIRLLQEEASVAGSADPSAHGSVCVTLSDGTVYLIDAEEPFLIGDVCCSCPSFFTRLRQYHQD